VCEHRHVIDTEGTAGTGNDCTDACVIVHPVAPKVAKRLDVLVGGKRVSRPNSLSSAMSSVQKEGATIRRAGLVLARFSSGAWVLTKAAMPDSQTILSTRRTA
jgi:hypothetical protein